MTIKLSFVIGTLFRGTRLALPGRKMDDGLKVQV